jgi:hypothetical protein
MPKKTATQTNQVWPSHRLAFGFAAIPPTTTGPLTPQRVSENADANQHQNQSGILVQTATPMIYRLQ